MEPGPVTRPNAPSRAAAARRRGRRSLLLGAGSAWMLAAGPPPAGAAEPDGAFRSAGGLAVYLGVVPAAVVRGHPPEHAGRGMHGGPPEGRYAHHLLVAVFDAATGARVSDAAVAAVVHGLKHSPEDRVALEPMTVGNAPAYGGFAELPPRDFYRIEVEVRRPGAAAPVRVVFRHRHLQP